MPLVLKDRVKETTTTTSTGTYTLAGAVTGYQAFSVIGDGNTTYYAVTNGTDWEVGIGTYTSSGTTLSRDTILESSNSGNAVNWSAGTKDIFCTYPAERSVYVDGANIVPATNSSLQVRVSSTASISSPLAFNSDNFDVYAATAQAGDLTINADSGTPGNGQKIIFRFTCDGTIRTITFTGGASKAFKPVGASLTVSGSNFTYALTVNKTTYFGCVYNTSSSRWEVVALSQEA